MKKPFQSAAILLLALSILSGCGTKRNVSGQGHQQSETSRRTDKNLDTHSARGKIVAEARKWLGVKYVYGGESRRGTDCSGMTMSVFRDAAGIKLPRDSRSQQQWCRPIKRKDLQRADLVFFATRAGGNRVGHVGIYIGDGNFIHASSSRGVIVSNLDQDYYHRHYHSAGRVPLKNESEPVMEFIEPPTEVERKQIPKSAEVSLDRLIEVMKAPVDSVTVIPMPNIEEPDSTVSPDSIRSSVINAFR